MTTIEQLIGDLLLRHNCVIIPSFGGFVARQESAKIDYAKGVVHPPSKLLLFNIQLINNDGLLISELAQINSLTYELASQIVREKIEEWNLQLKKGGRVELDRVGLLYLDAEQNICFEQDRFFNLLLESFGLGKIHFLTEEDVKIVENRRESVLEIDKTLPKPIIKNQKSVNTVTDNSQDENTAVSIVEHPILKRTSPPIWRYVAAACLIPIAFYSIWIPVKTDVLESGIISFKDFNPFHSSQPSVYESAKRGSAIVIGKTEKNKLKKSIGELPADVKQYTFKYDDDCFINVIIPGIEDSSAEEAKVIEQKTSPVQVNSINYIVGCFGDKTNADNLVLQLKSKGFAAFIFDQKNGLHRVSAGSALSEESLQSIEDKAESLGYVGWVLN